MILIETNAIERLIEIYEGISMPVKRTMLVSRESFDSVDDPLFWRSDVTAEDLRIARLFFSPIVIFQTITDALLSD